MQARQHDCTVGIHRKPQPIWESLKGSPSHVVDHRMVRQRILRNAPDGFVNLIDELDAQAFALRLVPCGGFADIEFGESRYTDAPRQGRGRLLSNWDITASQSSAV